MTREEIPGRCELVIFRVDWLVSVYFSDVVDGK